MKKAIPAACLLAGLFLLTGCGAESDDNNAPAAVVTAGASGHQLTLCTQSTTEGLYSVETFGQEHANILYIDYAAQQQVFLCNQPNCPHQDESCPSYISPEDSICPMVLASENHLFLIRSGVGIQIAAPSGDNRRELYTASDGQTLGPGFYTDETGDWLYFMLTEVLETGGPPQEQKTICRISLTDGELQRLADITGYGLMGIERDCFVVSTAEGNERRFYAVYPGYGEDGFVSAEPFYTGDISNSSAVLNDGMLYEYANETARLTITDLADGSCNTYDCSPYLSKTIPDEIPDLRGPYGGYLLLVSSEKQENGIRQSRYQPMNLADGTVLPSLELRDSLGSMITPQAAAGQDFCVIYDYTEIPVPDPNGTDGQLTTYSQPCYALIAQEDYFASSPAYRTITPAAVP